MMNSVIDYTINSYDYKHYNRIDANLPPPPTKMAQLIVTSLTTKCSIVVIEKYDYIQINGVRYEFGYELTSLNLESVLTILHNLIQESGVWAESDGMGRVKFTSNNLFTINSASYNVAQLCGLYDQKFPLLSSYENGRYVLLAQSIGNYLSTPVLYLVSNVGKSTFMNLNEDMNMSKIVLRINNSFSANYPIIVSNADFEVDINSFDLGHLQLTLVDANMREVHLLNPIYITIAVRAIPDEELVNSPVYNNIEYLQQQSQK